MNTQHYITPPEYLSSQHTSKGMLLQCEKHKKTNFVAWIHERAVTTFGQKIKKCFTNTNVITTLVRMLTTRMRYATWDWACETITHDPSCLWSRDAQQKSTCIARHRSFISLKVINKFYSSCKTLANQVTRNPRYHCINICDSLINVKFWSLL
jgi:hypothetical protein